MASKESVVMSELLFGLEDTTAGANWKTEHLPEGERGPWQTDQVARITIEDGSQFEVTVRRIK